MQAELYRIAAQHDYQPQEILDLIHRIAEHDAGQGHLERLSDGEVRVLVAMADAVPKPDLNNDAIRKVVSNGQRDSILAQINGDLNAFTGYNPRGVGGCVSVTSDVNKIMVTPMEIVEGLRLDYGPTSPFLNVGPNDAVFVIDGKLDPGQGAVKLLNKRLLKEFDRRNLYDEDFTKARVDKLLSSSTSMMDANPPHTGTGLLGSSRLLSVEYDANKTLYADGAVFNCIQPDGTPEKVAYLKGGKWVAADGFDVNSLKSYLTPGSSANPAPASVPSAAIPHTGHAQGQLHPDDASKNHDTGDASDTDRGEGSGHHADLDSFDTTVENPSSAIDPADRTHDTDTDRGVQSGPDTIANLNEFTRNQSEFTKEPFDTSPVGPTGMTGRELEYRLGGELRSATADSLAERLHELGNRSAAAVVVEHSPIHVDNFDSLPATRGVGAHAYTAVNDGGTIRYFDGPPGNRVEVSSQEVFGGREAWAITLNDEGIAVHPITDTSVNRHVDRMAGERGPDTRIGASPDSPHHPGDEGGSPSRSANDPPDGDGPPNNVDPPDRVDNNGSADDGADYSPNGDTGPVHDPADPGDINEGAAEASTQPSGNEEPRDCTANGEPVNVVTGEYFLPMTDVELPGVLPLRLTHQHRSQYRWGMWFGPNAVGTFDSRVIVDDDGVTSVDADGTMLRFTHPQPDSPVMQLQGRDWELSLTGTGGYRLRECATDLSHYFEPQPQLGGADVVGGAIVISAIMDRHLNRIVFSYDENGWPVAVEHSAGYRVEVATDGARILGYRLVAGVGGVPVDEQLRTFAYHDGHLAEVGNAVGASTYFHHDDDGRMVWWMDSLGQEYWNSYDDTGRVVRQSGVDGVWAGTFSYHQYPEGAGTFTTYTDAAGGVTTYGADGDGRLRHQVDALGRQYSTDYNRGRDPLRRVDPLGATSLYGYSDDGDLAEVIDPLGARTRIEYVAPRRPSVIVAADGARTSYHYDANGNVSSIVDNAGATTVFTYDDTGVATSITDADGVVTRYENNAAGQPVRIVDGLGNVTEIGYDAFGRVVSVVDAEGNVSSVTYDAEGRKTSETDASGATQRWTYDGEGNCRSHVDAMNAVTRWEYGYFDLPVARIDADGSRTTFTYDATRRLTAVTNAAGLQWRYWYNLDGTLAAETDFNGAATTYTYDAAGRLASRQNAVGQSVSFTYDACGRVVGESSAGGDPAFAGETIGYRFDSVGRLVSSGGVFGEWATQYSPVGRPIALSLGEQRIGVEWTPAGQLSSVVTPSGMRTQYAYDPRGVLEGVTAAGRACTVSTDRAGRETRRRFSGAAIDSVWDQVGRLVGRSVVANPIDPSAHGVAASSVPPESMIETTGFSYRPDGALVRSSGSSGVTEYGLDVMGRVVNRSQGDRREAYRFDPAGNMAAGGEWQFAGTLLTEDGRSSYRYDAAGRLVSVVTKRLSRRPDVWRYRWDAWDRLREITVPDGTVFAYSYDHTGRRVAKTNTTTGAVTRFGWLGDQMVEQSVLDHAGGPGETTSWAYAPGGLTPLAQVHSSGGSTAVGEHMSVVDTGLLNLGGPPGTLDAGSHEADQSWVDREFFAIVADQVSSPVALVEASSGEVVGRAVSSVWGLTAWSGEVSTPWRMPGQYFDAESGLHYNRFRYYQPGTGRYVSPDPLGLSPAPNPYSYPGNPTVVCDPLGLAPTGACEPGGLAKSGFIDPREVRFSQDNAGANFSDGRSVVDLVRDLTSGAVDASEIPAIRITYRGGELYSIDNRRLLAFQMANIEVPYTLLTSQEVAEALGKSLKRRFSTVTEGVSIEIRYRDAPWETWNNPKLGG